MSSDGRTWLLQHGLLSLGDRVFGQRMVKRLRFLEEAQWWSRERIDLYRVAALKTLARTIYSDVPLYREYMDGRGLTPEVIRSIDDLRILPITTKNSLRGGFPGRVTRRTGYKTFEVTTSGSTGQPFLVRRDTELDGWFRAAFLLALQWAQWSVGAPHLQLGMTLTRGLSKTLKDYFFQCHYVSAYDLTNQRLDLNLQLLERHSLRHIMGYPGSVYFLAKRAIEQGWNRPLVSVVTWGDNLTARQRTTIEAAFRTRVHDTYGCGEGMQVSAQCGCGSTYHLHDLDVIVEYLDHEDQPAAPGQPAHLVLTRLHPGPMPMVRYKVGDIGISGKNRTCECGRALEIMESIEGRDSDVIVTPAGNRLIVHYFTGVLEWFLDVDTFQVVQYEPGAITVRVVPNAAYSASTANRIIATLKDRGAHDLSIEVEVVNQIPLTKGGKRRFVISALPPPHEHPLP